MLNKRPHSGEPIARIICLAQSLLVDNVNNNRPAKFISAVYHQSKLVSCCCGWYYWEYSDAISNSTEGWDAIVGYLTSREAYLLRVGYYFQVMIYTHENEDEGPDQPGFKTSTAQSREQCSRSIHAIPTEQKRLVFLVQWWFFHIIFSQPIVQTSCLIMLQSI